jgi:two-component system phosphate regulon sensor histidine kinase PhoR
MRKTLLKIIFFSILIIGFVIIQYDWLKSIQKDKLETFKLNVVGSIHTSVMAMPLNSARNKSKEELFAFHPRLSNTGNLGNPLDSTSYKLDENAMSAIFRRSFYAEKLGNIPFEYSMVIGNNRITTRGFDQAQLNNSRDLVYYYPFQGFGESSTSTDQLIVVIPSWEKLASKGIGWLIAASLIITTLLVIVFSYTFIMIGQKQKLLYESRTNVIKSMVQQLESPLSTVSVAVEAMRNEGVMHDAGKIKYYQQVIIDENKRMNEQVNKLLQDLR